LECIGDHIQLFAGAIGYRASQLWCALEEPGVIGVGAPFRPCAPATSTPPTVAAGFTWSLYEGGVHLEPPDIIER
jgi:hypothetical protein